MSSTPSQHYFETQVELTQEPLLLAARLAGSGAHPDHVIYEHAGDWSYAGGALVEITVDRTGARMRRGDEPETLLPWNGQPLRQVQQLLDSVTVAGWRAYGWAAFELSYAKDGDLGHVGDGRLLHLVIPRAEVRFTEGHARLRAADQETLTALIDLLTGPAPEVSRPPKPMDVRGVGRPGYQDAVKFAVEEIEQRELHKVILSRVVDVTGDIDLISTYVVGRRRNNPARSFLLDLGGLEAAGFSPEIVVQVSADGRVVSQPLAGTRALTADLLANERLRADLLASSKEVYEHAISVKTGVDELADVCEPGSVEVPEFMAVRERGSVQHLASRLSGQLAPGCRAWDAFGAVFPAVTASGVPKEAAYTSIRRHEDQPRGLYSGAVLTVDQDGSMDAALVLRSVYRQNGRTWLRAGAGIVEQSIPEREFEETCEKLDSVARHLVPAENPEA
ncbi:salicylate synthase [Streptomyces sp. NPDC050509]|uniref:salicylate synthase n=1 Tax=Streptomyces sp. NPDC050509 TaxID=3365620 RepID=UPI0037A5B989